MNEYHVLILCSCRTGIANSDTHEGHAATPVSEAAWCEAIGSSEACGSLESRSHTRSSCCSAQQAGPRGEAGQKPEIQNLSAIFIFIF